MKKIIAVFTVTLALVAAAVAADAKIVVMNNAGDDFGFFLSAKSKIKYDVDLNTTNNVVEEIYTLADTGGSFIASGDDTVNASLESDDALNETSVQGEVGSIIVTTNGCPCENGAEADVTVIGNSSDDAIITADDEVKFKDELDATSTNNVYRNIAAISRAGEMFIASGEDTDTAGILTGKATTRTTLQFLTGSFLITRN